MADYAVLPLDEQTALATIEGLPKSLRELGETCGLLLVVHIVAVYGGTRLWVPNTLPEDHELVRRLGADYAKQLHEYAYGTYIEVPRSLVSKKFRNQMIKEMAANGVKQGDIARLSGCCDRTVRNVLTHTGPWKCPKTIDMFSR